MRDDRVGRGIVDGPGKADQRGEADAHSADDDLGLADPNDLAGIQSLDSNAYVTVKCGPLSMNGDLQQRLLDRWAGEAGEP